VLIIGVFLLGSVTKEVRIQKELAKLTLDKAKSEFVTIAAHQLRTPLSAVRWSFGLLRTGSSLDNNDRDIASKGAQAADNMMYIVNDLLNVARMEHGTIQFDMADGDLRDVVRIATDVLNEAAKKKSISLRVSVPDTPVMTRFDQDKMVMVAENLVDNAIKYTPQGGSIAVELSTGEATARLRVTDTGIGISRGDSARLFERFFRSDRAKRMLPDGSGLGLYIVKTMVDGHKGTVRLEPAPQSGTIATVEIPLVHGPSSVSGTAVSGSSPQGILRT
jgi:signal transduction histidine kinase